MGARKKGRAPSPLACLLIARAVFLAPIYFLAPATHFRHFRFLLHLWPIFTTFVVNYWVCHFNSIPFVYLLLINGTPFTYLV